MMLLPDVLTGNPHLLPDMPDRPGVLLLTTIRSHGQYNTTVYELNDRYRGVFGRRDIVFMQILLQKS